MYKPRSKYKSNQRKKSHLKSFLKALIGTPKYSRPVIFVKGGHISTVFEQRADSLGVTTAGSY